MSKEIGKGWKNPKPLKQLKKDVRRWRKKNIKKKPKKRSGKALGKPWRRLTTKKQRLAYLEEWASVPRVPPCRRVKRKSRRPIRRWMRCECCNTLGRVARHHALPLSCGGKDCRDNIVYVCGDCHVLIHPWMQNAPVNEEWLERDAKDAGLTYD
jgi:hypothetical protein